jgi:hypothetical protein
LTPRRSRLPKVWIWTSIGLIGSVVLGLAWWQQQLPSRLRNAVQRDELERCLQLGSQLAALRQLKPQEQALLADCLRQQAQRSWAEQRWRAALDQQRGLVLRSANPAIEERQLQAWRDQIRQRALDLFQQGQAREALNLLQLSGETRFPSGQQLHSALAENWAANRYAFSRAGEAAGSEQWWQALDQLNQLDHPWWQNQATPLRGRVESQAAALQKANNPKDSHGEQGGMTVPDLLLDAAVRHHLSEGLSAWMAFQQACAELGGQVLEEGPESSCRR